MLQILLAIVTDLALGDAKHPDLLPASNVIRTGIIVCLFMRATYFFFGKESDPTNNDIKENPEPFSHIQRSVDDYNSNVSFPSHSKVLSLENIPPANTDIPASTSTFDSVSLDEIHIVFSDSVGFDAINYILIFF